MEVKAVAMEVVRAGVAKEAAATVAAGRAAAAKEAGKAAAAKAAEGSAEVAKAVAARVQQTPPTGLEEVRPTRPTLRARR